jgi:hypothetical protein
LAQVMIEVFVHPGGPLLRREAAEEGMRMLRALRFPALVKLPDVIFKLFLFSSEISFIGDHKFLVGGTVPGKWLAVGKGGPDKGSKDPANEQPGQNEAPGRHVERRGTMCHHLRDLHFPPLVLGRGLQLVDAGDYLVDRVWLE